LSLLWPWLSLLLLRLELLSSLLSPLLAELTLLSALLTKLLGSLLLSLRLLQRHLTKLLSDLLSSLLTKLALLGSLGLELSSLLSALLTKLALLAELTLLSPLLTKLTLLSPLLTKLALLSALLLTKLLGSLLSSLKLLGLELIGLLVEWLRDPLAPPKWRLRECVELLLTHAGSRLQSSKLTLLIELLRFQQLLNPLSFNSGCKRPKYWHFIWRWCHKTNAKESGLDNNMD